VSASLEISISLVIVRQWHWQFVLACEVFSHVEPKGLSDYTDGDKLDNRMVSLEYLWICETNTQW